MERKHLYTSLKVAAAIYIIASILVTAGCNPKGSEGEGNGLVGANGSFPACVSQGCLAIDPNARLMSGVQSRSMGNWNGIPDGLVDMRFDVFGTFTMQNTGMNGWGGGWVNQSAIYNGPIALRGVLSLTNTFCGIPAGTYDFDTIEAGMLQNGMLMAGQAAPGAVPVGMRLYAVKQGTGERFDFHFGTTMMSAGVAGFNGGINGGINNGLGVNTWGNNWNTGFNSFGGSNNLGFFTTGGWGGGRFTTGSSYFVIDTNNCNLGFQLQ